MPVELTFSGPQSEFLGTSADIVLYGGAAGSGKSYVAIVDLLGLNEPGGTPRYRLPFYRGLIYRKHRADLANLIDESKKLYPLFDPEASFNNTDLFWTFSSGAKLYFKFFENIDQATTFLQGQQLAAITCDELASYETDEIFRYSLSRLRSPEGLKCYYRATCNPGRYPWLREFFRIDNEGHSTDFTVDNRLSDGTIHPKRIKFIRARLSDNKYIDTAEYESNLRMLAIEDQLALADGRWDAYDNFEGVVYRHELAQLLKETRLCRVPHDPALKVHTAWDLGIAYGCVMFMQIKGQERHVINMICGPDLSIRDHYIPRMREWEKTLGYQYGGHYLPHDSAKRDNFTGKTLFDQVSEVLPGCQPIKIAPVADGIQQTKAIFRNIWIDSESGVYDQLAAYKYRWSPSLMQWMDPVHDKYSHAADAFRYLSVIQEAPARPSWLGPSSTTPRRYGY